MEKFGRLPTELKLMVVRVADLRDVCAMARTCKDNHLICTDVILERSKLETSNELCRAIRRMAFENKVIRDRAARERPDNGKTQGDIATTKHKTASRETKDDIDYIISCNRWTLQLRHFWLAVELADCGIISRLARETNIREEWEEFRDLGLGNENTYMFGYLLKLAMEPPTNDLVEALLDLLKIDKSCGDATGVNRLTEALMGAFRFGNLELVKKLIALGTGPERSSEGEWSLMAACNDGNPFLSRGASVYKNHEPKFRITILSAAVEGNNVEIVQYLLDNEEFINHVNSSMAKYAEALFSKAYDSHVKQEIRHMLYEELDVQRARDIVDKIYVPKWLHYAVQRNDLSMTRLFLKPRLNQVADRPASPLFERSYEEDWPALDVLLGVALEKQSEDVAKFLLEKACSCYRLNTLSCKTRAAILDRAMRTDNKFLFSSALSINDFGKQTPGEDTLFHYIRESGTAEKLLLEKKNFGLSGEHIDIDARSQDGETPLVKNCHRNNIQMVNFLLLQNAGIKAAKKTKRTCLQVAAKEADVKLVNLLLEYGADMKSKSYESARFAALRIAVNHQRWEVVEALLAKSAHIGYSSLLKRLRRKGKGYVELSTLLIRLNKYKEKRASKLLGYVMQNPRVELSIIDRLLAQGVDPNRQYDDAIRSPLAEACYHGRKDIAETLRNHGAIVEADADGTASTNAQAQTTLEAAVAGGHIETVSWLLGLKEVRHEERESRDSWLSLCKVAARGEIDILRFLLGRGNANLSSEDIGIILTEGVEKGRVEIVQYLIEKFDFTRTDIGRLDLLQKARSGRMTKTLKTYLADINWG